MIRNLLIPDYRIHDILASIGVLTLTLLVQQLTVVYEVYIPSLIIMTDAWGMFTIWEQLTTHKG